MNATDYTMTAPTFITTASGDGTFCMNDLKVTPKEGTTPPSIRWGSSVNGIGAGEFVVQFLQSTGAPAAEYTWVWYAEGTQSDYVTKTKWQIWDKTAGESGAWVDCNQEQLTAKHDAGTAMWIKGAGHTLTPAGQVYNDDVEFETSPESYTAVGNNSPVDLKVSDLTVTPKEGTTPPSIRWGSSVNGIGAGEFVVQFLQSTGAPEFEYTWLWYAEGTQSDYVTKTKWQIWDKTAGESGAWVDCTPDQLDFPVRAGKGLWVKGAGHTLNIPGPELK